MFPVSPAAGFLELLIPLDLLLMIGIANHIINEICKADFSFVLVVANLGLLLRDGLRIVAQVFHRQLSDQPT